jgi:integrase
MKRHLIRSSRMPIPYVFHRHGRPIRDLYKRWREACKAAKISDRLIHDLRRTAVRNLERAGVPRSVATKLTGHKTESVYRRYAIVAKADLTEGVAKLARLHQLLEVKSEATG